MDTVSGVFVVAAAPMTVEIVVWLCFGGYRCPLWSWMWMVVMLFEASKAEWKSFTRVLANCFGKVVHAQAPYRMMKVGVLGLC
jgi:hypothetical protein